MLLGLATGTRDLDAASIALTLLREAVGAVAFGAVLGYAAFLLLRSIDSYAVEIMITIALSTGGYALAELIHVSAPISVVVMGLLIGNHGRELAMSAHTREQLFSLWELADDLLNLLLFGLIGLELVALARSELEFIEVALTAVPLVLLTRWISVAVPITALGAFRRFERHGDSSSVSDAV